MANRSQSVLQRQHHAMLACYMCRKRKIKCGRQVPACMTCKDTAQECIYPAKAMRPGPKIGSVNANVSQKRQSERRSCEQPPLQKQNTKAGSVSPPATDPPSSTGGQARSSTVLSLSFIIHPTSEDCSSAQTDPAQDPSHGNNGIDALKISCDNLGLTMTQLDTLLARYFEVFTSFQLFRLTELREKLINIPTTHQQTALLSSMLAFGLKGLTKSDVSRLVHANILSEVEDQPSIHFRALSIRYMDHAIAELGDELLPLPLLQAMILNAHCLLVQGVLGRAWRYLGICIRAAYELNLHLIDAGKNTQDSPVSAEQWCIEEEWRRAWWAIWEMDVFASVVRRCPAGIDWTQNDTFLPAEDTRWYSGLPQQSCFLEFNVNDRWKSLAACKNRSPRAWFIVVNSLMKDAQTISSPAGIDKPHLSATLPSQRADMCSARLGQRQQVNKKSAAIGRLKTISNALYCTVLALPEDLKYRGQLLNFGGCHLQSENGILQRLSQSFIYSIYLMTQLTKMMVLKYHVFRSSIDWTSSINRHHSTNDSNAVDYSTGDHEEFRYLDQYFETASRIISMVRSCSEDYYKHVNPFLASTVWLAGSVELLHRSRLPEGSPDQDLVTSNFDLVSLLYEKTVSYWNMSRVPLRNWGTLERGLEAIKDNSAGGDRFHFEAPCVFKVNKLNGALPIRHEDHPKEMTMSTNADGAEIASVRKAPNTRMTQIAGEGEELSVQQHHPVALETAGLPRSPPVSSPNTWITNAFHTTSAQQGCLEGTQNASHQSLLELTPPESVPEGGGREWSAFAATETNDQAFSPNILDTMPSFPIDLQDVNTDFSNYLDDIFSGSYLP